MRRLSLLRLTGGLAVGLALLLPVIEAAARAPRPALPPEPASLPLLVEETAAPAPGLISSVTPDTTWFGGTHWDAVDQRWEANAGGRWTFDSGVGSSINQDPAKKAVGLHATLEGWTGVDLSWPDAGRFARSATCALTGGWSAFAGLPQAAADSLCYATGQGYGNDWNVGLRRSFAYPGAGSVTFSFRYGVEAEDYFDSLLVIVDTTGTGAASGIALAGYSGVVGGTASFMLTPGVTLPTTAHAITLAFIARSDGGYSDEDGLYATACGLGRVDDITLTGAITSVSTFEAGADGWSSYTPWPANAVGGDWSDLRDFSSLPPPASGCALQDTVLTFMNPGASGGGHRAGEYCGAISPWIDLEEAGLNVDGRRFLELDEYLENPDPSGSGARPYLEIAVQWRNGSCWYSATGGLSSWELLGYQSAPPGGSLCRTGGCPLRVELPYHWGIPPRAVRIRLAYTSGCLVSGVCAPTFSPTPHIDNVRVGILATEFNTRAQDLPRDAFPTDTGGTLSRLTSPARLDANTLKTARAGLYQAMGDTLVVRASSDLNDIRVNVRVRPGPGINTTRLTAWLATLRNDGGGWYSARMDTAEVGGVKSAGSYMTAFHESDPAFTGRDTDKDTADRDPNGRLSRLKNDIFPDNLFTPGTRIELWYRASVIAAPGTYYALPDTTGGRYIQYEVLPSSITSGLAQNHVLYINHAGPGSPVPAALQAGLAAVLPGGSANAEGVAWDRFDLPWASGAHPSVASPATIKEIVINPLLMAGYTRVVYGSGELATNAMSADDETFLSGWLSCVMPVFGNTPGCGRALYATGDALVSSLATLHGTGQPLHWLGIRPGVPGAGVGAPACRALVGMGPYNHFGGAATYGLDPAIAGSLCASPPAVAKEAMLPDVQLQSGAQGRPNLEYAMAPGADASVSSVYWYTYTNPGGHTSYSGYHKTVTDGFSAERLRAACAGGTELAARLGAVFAWFDEPESLPVSAVPAPEPPAPGALLGPATPNPLAAGETTRWQLVLPVPGRVRLALYDVSGRLVRRLLDQSLPTGPTEVAWDGRDDRGARVRGGLYFVRGAAGGAQFRQKLVVRP